MNVDDVGAAAVAMAAKAVRRSVPQLLNSRRELKCEPLEPRDAFILSLVDGHMDMLAIIDVSGMPPGTVLPILARLAELGLVALP